MNKFQDDLLRIFFVHQIRIKMYHFQTEDYGAHKASDMYLGKFLLNFDRYMEASQGLYGRTKLKKVNVNVEVMNDSNVSKELDKFIDLLNTFGKRMPNDLGVIKDEMLADAQQLKYLLTFK